MLRTILGTTARPSSSASAAQQLLRSLTNGRRYLVSSSRIACEKAADAGKDGPPPLGVPYSELTVGIPKENFPLERRVAGTPDSVSRLIKPGFSVIVERGAGEASYFADADYEAAGAKVVDSVWKDSDIVLKVSN